MDAAIELPTLDGREQLRRAASSRPGFYSPWLHLAAPSLSGLAIVVACALALRDLRAVDGAFALFVLVLSNAVEWHTHRDLLHKRFGPLGVLYDRHTPLHHRVFVAGEMAMRDTSESPPRTRCSTSGCTSRITCPTRRWSGRCARCAGCANTTRRTTIRG